VATYHRGQFLNVDTFIAFMGMDVRVRDSGHFRGKRKLTKKGEPELRRILFNAAMRGRCNAHWEPYYLTQLTPMRLQSDIESILASLLADRSSLLSKTATAVPLDPVALVYSFLPHPGRKRTRHGIPVAIGDEEGVDLDRRFSDLKILLAPGARGRSSELSRVQRTQSNRPSRRCGYGPPGPEAACRARPC